MGGQRVTVRVTYENTGSEPHAFSAIAWAGEIVGQGQIDPEVQGTVRGPMVGPGSRSTLEVPLELPQTAAPGSYEVQVFAWDPNTFVPGDPSTYLIREQVLDVFTVEALPVEVAPPLAAQPPVEMAPQGPPVPSPGDLGQPSVQFSPSTVEMGQLTQGSISIPNLADFPFTARVTVSLIDSGGQGV